MGIAWGYGALVALITCLIAGTIAAIRPSFKVASLRGGSNSRRSFDTRPSEDISHLYLFAGCAVGIFVPLLFLDSLIFYYGLPDLTVPKIFGLIFLHLMFILVATIVADAASHQAAGGVFTGIITLLFVVVWLIGSTLVGNNAEKVSSIVKVTTEKINTMPASSTSHMVVVSEDIATARAHQAMASGESGQKNYNTYLTLGDATLQYVDGKMVYVFPLHYTDWRYKNRLNGIEPGYIEISAEDPQAEPIERYGNQFSMKICAACGQYDNPDRYAYYHGYAHVLDDPTLELDDQGRPYWTMTVDTAHVAWRFFAPQSLLVIDAHSGAIKHYSLNAAPAWVDRVYSQQEAQHIANWYGMYGIAKTWKWPLHSNANRFKVSGDPVLVYTGDGHPDWRMLLTSFNSDTAVSRIVIMDAHSGAMRVYTPQNPLSVEQPAYDAFNSASGQGAGQVKANHYRAVGLTLHVIYGHLTWMATYEPEGANPSFVGLGFVDAYHATANNVVFGNSRSAALENYQQQLADEGSSNGNDPGQGGQVSTISGKITATSWDVSGGQKFWYVELANDTTHVYTGTISNVGPAIAFAKKGDTATITYKAFGGKDESTRAIQSFNDAQVPLKKSGS